MTIYRFHGDGVANREIDRRVRELVQREVTPDRNDIRVLSAAELSAEDRARYGFEPDWLPGNRRRRR